MWCPTREGSDDTRTVPSGSMTRPALPGQRDGTVDVGRQYPCGERVGVAIPHDRRRRDVLGDGDHALSAHVAELAGRLGHRHRRDRDQHHRDHQQLEHQELAGQAALPRTAMSQ